MTTVGGTPDEKKWLASALTFPVMSLEEAFGYQRTGGQVIIHRGGETATFTLYNRAVSCFPTGLVPYIRSCSPYEIDLWDETGCRYGDGLDKATLEVLDGVELRQYQLDAVHLALRWRRGVLQHPTGAGKTEVAAAILKCLPDDEFPALFLVHTKFLLEQAAERFDARGVRDIAVYGDGSHNIAKTGVTVATIQGLCKGRSNGCDKAQWLLDNTVTLMCDEAHHAGAQTFYDVGMALTKARNRLGLTMQLAEMPGVYNPFDLHTVGVLGPVIHEIPPVYLRSKGWQSNPVIITIPTGGENIVWRKWQTAYDDGIVRHVYRNSVDILLARAAYDVGRKVLIFVHRKPHGHALLQSLGALGISAIYCTGQSRVSRMVRGQIRTERWPFDRVQSWVDEPGGRVVIGTSVIDEGADLPQTDTLILAVGGKAFRRLRQRVGRGLRPSGSDCTLVFDHEDYHNPKLREHAVMRQYVWAYDSIPSRGVDCLPQAAGFAMPEYSAVYTPPTLSTTMQIASPVPGMSAHVRIGPV